MVYLINFLFFLDFILIIDYFDIFGRLKLPDSNADSPGYNFLLTQVILIVFPLA